MSEDATTPVSRTDTFARQDYLHGFGVGSKEEVDISLKDDGAGSYPQTAWCYAKEYFKTHPEQHSLKIGAFHKLYSGTHVSSYYNFIRNSLSGSDAPGSDQFSARQELHFKPMNLSSCVRYVTISLEWAQPKAFYSTSQIDEIIGKRKPLEMWGVNAYRKVMDELGTVLPQSRSFQAHLARWFTERYIELCRQMSGSEWNEATGTVDTCVASRTSMDWRVNHSMQWTDVGLPLPDTKPGRAMIALGSNMGNRTETIEAALELMRKHGIVVNRVSSLYETAPMYVEAQAPFLNGMAEVTTTKNQEELLDTLHLIEDKLDRKRVVDKGPRTIDLDITLFDYQNYSSGRLTIPHIGLLERDFVLNPLAELIPHERLPAPLAPLSISRHLEILESKSPSPTPAYPITQISTHLPPLLPTLPTRRTLIMAILNLTPDSFSDGGVNDSLDTLALIKTVANLVDSGAQILDLGGQSTRPGATLLDPETELSRLLPAIHLIRSHPDPNISNITISIDTFYSSVASAALAAGADFINDVSAGVMDPAMIPTLAPLHSPVVLMHMRGTPQTMSKLTSYPTGIIHGVGTELLSRVHAAEEAGIRRWRIVLDPGLGFAKTQAQNLQLLRDFDKLRAFPGLEGLAWLVGPSRKGFVGKATGVKEASERAFGTAAAVTAAVGGGADIVRVHDVKEMVEVVRMAEAMWRVERVESDEALKTRRGGKGDSVGTFVGESQEEVQRGEKQFNKWLAKRNHRMRMANGDSEEKKTGSESPLDQEMKWKPEGKTWKMRKGQQKAKRQTKEGGNSTSSDLEEVSKKLFPCESS